MSWVWNLLSKADERAVVLREPSRRDQLSNRNTVQAGQDLGAEDFRVRALTRPRAHRGLMRSVLGSADLGGSSAVCWVALLGAHASEDVRRVVSALRCMSCPALGAAFVAVAFAAIG